MTTVSAIIFYFLLLVLGQKILIIFLTSGINQELKALRQRGDLSVGLHRNKLGLKTYAAVCIREDTIVSIKILRQITLLSKFRSHQIKSSIQYEDLLQSMEQQLRKTGSEQAIVQALQQYQRRAA